jgi:putative membrane protein
VSRAAQRSLLALILVYGGHYTYARTPLGFWFQELFELSRHRYHRLGHFAQGFVPAVATREILSRTSTLGSSCWLPLLTVCVCLAISATYELDEWWAALLVGAGADEFLATQGDMWDTQWGTFLATIGTILSLVMLSATHDRQLERPGSQCCHSARARMPR